MGFGLVLTTIIQQYIDIGHIFLAICGLICGFACIYIYALLLLKKTIKASIQRFTWTLSGIYLIGMFFTLLKYTETEQAPIILWMLLGLLAVARIGIFALQIKSS
jgi:hypothetical protein